MNKFKVGDIFKGYEGKKLLVLGKIVALLPQTLSGDYYKILILKVFSKSASLKKGRTYHISKEELQTVCILYDYGFNKDLETILKG